MRNRSYVFPVFLLCLAASFFIYFMGSGGVVGFFQNSMQSIFFPFSLFAMHQDSTHKESQLEILQKENASLRSQLSDMRSLQEDNKALRDQFAANNPSSQKLMPAEIVGMNFIPNVTFPETFIIHAGIADGVKGGEVILNSNTIVGQVVKVSRNYSQVQLVSSGKTTFPIKVAETGAIGVLKGQGNGILIVDNILLSDTIQVGNTIVSMSSQDIHGNGYPQGLVVGKVLSVEKNPSNLFQKAKIEQLINIEHLARVFVLLN